MAGSEIGTYCGRRSRRSGKRWWRDLCRRLGRCRRSGRAAEAPPPEAPCQRRALEAAGGGA